MTFAQYVVFAEEIYKSAVNDNVEDFHKVAVEAYPTVVIGVKKNLHFCGLGLSVIGSRYWGRCQS